MNAPLSRRNFVKTSMLATTALGLQPSLWGQTAANPRISVQLYSVRDACSKDFDAALADVAKMGFAGVEFAGYHKYDGKAKELRQKLDELGLVAAGTHIGTGSFRGDALQRTIDFHQTLGCKYLIVPGDGDFTNPEKSKTPAAQKLRQAMEQAKTNEQQTQAVSTTMPSPLAEPWNALVPAFKLILMPPPMEWPRPTTGPSHLSRMESATCSASR